MQESQGFHSESADPKPGCLIVSRLPALTPESVSDGPVRVLVIIPPGKAHNYGFCLTLICRGTYH